MDDKNALVPLNVSKLEKIPVDVNSRLTADQQKGLLNVLLKKLGENHRVLEVRTNEIRQEVYKKAKKDVGFDDYLKAVHNLETKIATMNTELRKAQIALKNKTGFNQDGELLHFGSYRCNNNDYEEISEGVRRARAVSEKADLACQVVERFATKFDKVQTRLLLATTKGEAMAIMDAVLGNGDEILIADDEE